MRRSYCIDFLLLILLLIVTGCQFQQAAFPRMASNAGSAFAAAATTLAYAHEGKVTYAYAAASFVNYQSELDGLDQTLPFQNGTPDKRTIQHLLDLDIKECRVFEALKKLAGRGDTYKLIILIKNRQIVYF